MRADDDWTRWTDDWQDQPVVDVRRLQRRVTRKLWQMRAMVVWRWSSGLVVVGLVARLQLISEIPLALRVWAALMIPLFATLLYFRLRVYRGTWHPASASVRDLLYLTATRAKAGIRLAWVNIIGILVVAGASLLMAVPGVLPSRWQHDLASRQSLISLLLVGGLFLTLNVVYMRQQRKQLHDVEALLEEASDEHAPQ